MRTLDLTGWDLKGYFGAVDIPFAAVVDAVAENSGELETLRLGALLTAPSRSWRSVVQIEELLQAAPLLTVLECDVECTPAEAVRLLCTEPPFAPLRCQDILVQRVDDDEPEADVPALAAALASHEPLSGASLVNIPLPTFALLDSFVSAAIQLQLRRIFLFECDLAPQSLPSLTRLLTAGAVEDLSIVANTTPIFVGETVGPFCAALRASQLSTVNLGDNDMWESLDDAALVIAALTGHPTIKRLDLSENFAGNPAARLAAGTMLASLVAGTGSVLEHLDVSYSDLGNEGAGRLLWAVAASDTLLELRGIGNGISAAYARVFILPAVHANASLRELTLRGIGDVPELVEAEALVRARR